MMMNWDLKQFWKGGVPAKLHDIDLWVQGEPTITAVPWLHVPINFPASLISKFPVLQAIILFKYAFIIQVF